MILWPGPFSSQVPFSCKKGYIPCGFKCFSKGNIVSRKSMQIFRGNQLRVPSRFPPVFPSFGSYPVGDTVPCSKFTGHNTGTGWTANSAAGITMFKYRSLPGNPVYVGCLIVFTPHHAKVMHPKIISQDKNNIWWTHG